MGIQESASKCTWEQFQSQAAGMGDSQVMTRQPLRQSCSKLKTDFSDMLDEDEDDEEDDGPPPPPLIRLSEEERIRIRKIRAAEVYLYNLNQGEPECEDDDPDPSVTRTDISLVCVPAITNQYQDASASSYLGDQAGNTNTVDRILVGISGAGSRIVWRSNRESQDVAGYLQGEPVGPFGGKLDREGTRHKGAAGRGVCGLRQEAFHPG